MKTNKEKNTEHDKKELLRVRPTINDMTLQPLKPLLGVGLNE